jgi:hypothetical protein
MTIYYKATDRKPLVKAISEFTGAKPVYLKTPTYAYQIDYFTVTREGNLEFDDMADSEEIEKLIEALAQQGFIAESTEYDSEQQEPVIDGEEPLEDCPPAYATPEDEITGICISMPRSIFTDANLENLKGIIAAKRSLICKALGTDDLPLEITDTKVSFPWFMGEPTMEEIRAYDTFICKLCEMARNQKRVSAKEKEVDNEKYAFRCFLLRLGFIGNEYKAGRKILLRNLAGSSAFKGGQPKEVEVCE